MALLSDADLDAGLAALPGWARQGNEIVKTYQCPSFADAIAFVTRVGFLAEKANHHPDIDVRWRNVKMALTNHDAGGLTQQDLDMATQIEQVAPK